MKTRKDVRNPKGEQMIDKTTKDKILAIINEHVKVPKGMEDRVCETLYKAYVEAKEELI